MGGETHTGRASRAERRERNRRVAELAKRQHGVVSRAQLLGLGISRRSIERRIEGSLLHRLHRGVYAVGHERLAVRGRWMAAVLACGEGALLSHRGAAALWGLAGIPRGPIDVLAEHARRRPGIASHRGAVDGEDRATRDGIPVTSVARTIFDLAEIVDERRLRRHFEEADRLRLIETRALRGVCARNPGRHAAARATRLLDSLELPSDSRSALEDRFVELCREHRLPRPQLNVRLLDVEVDAVWPRARLVIELDGFAYHRHRAAFERDRARDAALQAAGYRVVRLTDRRLRSEAKAVAAELSVLLAP